MPTGFAITAILSFALSIACFRMARDSKTCRLRWMDILGALEEDHDREIRKAQERQIAVVCMILFCLFATLSLSCTYWAYDEIRESRREKSPLEHEMALGEKEVQGMRLRFGRR